MGAAYNLARWITRNDEDARDVVQEAMLRAFRFFEGFEGGNTRAWLLTIVRNTAFDWMRKSRLREDIPFEEEVHSGEEAGRDPESLAVVQADAVRLGEALRALPVFLREAILLREQEGLSYKEIASVTGVPMGTVMSRLARARSRLIEQLASSGRKDH